MHLLRIVSGPADERVRCAGALDIAVAGTQGFALYDRRSGKWRLFGDVGQERAFTALHLGWLGDVVAVCRQEVAARKGGGGDAAGECSLVLHSRFFLDEQTVMAQRPLHQVRIAASCARAGARWPVRRMTWPARAGACSHELPAGPRAARL